MDIGLPDMQGHAWQRSRSVSKKKQQVKPSTPIIALTGHGATDIQSFVKTQASVGVMSKPLSREQAETIWRRYVNRSRDGAQFNPS